MPTYNWQQLMDAAGEAGFTVWQPGEYEVEVAKAEATTASTGKDMIKVQFRATSGPMKGKGTVFNQFVISPESEGALRFFFRHMAALGLDSDFFKAGPSMDQVASALVSRRCRIKVGIRQWQGEDQNDVTAVLKPLPTSSGPTPASAPVAPPPAPGVPSGVPSTPPAAVAPPAPVPAPAHVPEPVHVPQPVAEPVVEPAAQVEAPPKSTTPPEPVSTNGAASDGPKLPF